MSIQEAPQVHADVHLFASGDDHFEEAYRRYSDVLITTSLEEREKLRRLSDKAGEESRRSNSAKVADIIQQKNNSGMINEFVEAHSSKGIYEIGAQYASSLLSASSDATHAASEIGHMVASKANAYAHQGAEMAQAVADNIGFSGLVKSAFSKVSDLWEDLSDTLTWARIVEIEEIERERRMQSSSEARAVLNAQKVSSLIKELGLPFYRPSSEPSSYYGTQLVEDMERTRRIWEDSTGKVAITNAQGVSEIVKDSVRLLKTSGHLNIPDITPDSKPVVLEAPRTLTASAVSQ